VSEKLDDIQKGIAEMFAEASSFNEFNVRISERFLSLTDENERLKKDLECWKKWGRHHVSGSADISKSGLLGLVRGDWAFICFDTTAERDDCYDWLMKQREGK